MSIDTLRKAVQLNCDLSDREFAADYTICIYLIRMREYYRWSQGISPIEPLAQDALLEWITATESRWDAIETDEFQPLVFDGKVYQPFDARELNRVLHPLGYTYSAGYGRFNKPVFMLAELDSVENTERYSLSIAGRELARELSAPPAVMQQGEILIRTQAVTRLIWDLLEEWSWHKPDNAMAQLVKYYDFEGAPLTALEQAAVDQQEVLILHEIGELLADEMVDPRWNDMLLDEDSHRQLFARAVRDCLADCLSTLPGLIAEDNQAGLHFYFASLTPMRKSMFPSLADSYRTWRAGGSLSEIKEAIKRGRSHWLQTAQRLTDDFAAGGRTAQVSVQSYIEQFSL